MRRLSFTTSALTLGLAAAAGLTVAYVAPAVPLAAAADPVQSIGPLAFAPDGTLFLADTRAAAIHAIDLGPQARTGPAGAKDVAAIDGRIAAMLGTDTASIQVTDLAVHPATRNAYLAVMRGSGPEARPALLRVDGAGELSVIALDGLARTSAALPNAPADAEGRRNPRLESITDMAFVDGQLIVSGLSNEEFSSKLRTIPYPFARVEAGTSVEIYHGNHGQLETRSPVISFVPYTLDGTAHVIAGYTCTPLVKFPMASLTAGEKITGTTIAELGNRNRPTDMVVYKKDGRDYLLIANTSRGVMKVPTAPFASAAAITAPVKSETGGVGFEPVTSLTGIEQLDLLDAQRALVLARSGEALALQAVPLP
jgi:hypothetical protein